jgi:hypothetical protein
VEILSRPWPRIGRILKECLFDNESAQSMRAARRDDEEFEEVERRPRGR